MAKAQASEANYELESLGWKAFQDLCATIVGDVLGQTVQTFLPGNDGGRDGAFHGKWTQPDGTQLEGSFTVQCKFSATESSITLSSLSDELVKARRLAKKGLAKNFLLMTNCGLSGANEEKIRAAFLGIPGIEHFVAFGRDWITRKIRESPRLRILVPRVYGLGDLSQILDERAYSQATMILSSLGEDLSKFVVTQAHKDAARALVEHGFVILLGEPAAGKSTIAAALAIGALDNWNTSTLKIRTADEFVAHWNPEEPTQFFWVDDAFGATQYQRELGNDWSRAFPHLRVAIRSGARVVFTSRDYIYRSARWDLKASAFPLLSDSQVVIDVESLNHTEKEQILYNHMKLGTQPIAFRRRIKKFLPEIVNSDHFLPEIARRLADPLFTRDLAITSGSINEFVEKPLHFLSEVVSNLDAPSRAALGLIFMRGGSLQSPIDLSPDEALTLDRLGATVAEATQALDSLQGSLVLLAETESGREWRFRHPTVGDAYASIVSDNPELLDLYVSGTKVSTLINEVACGVTELEGVKVVIPQSRFPSFADRLDSLTQENPLFNFLSNRCSREFLSFYLEKHPGILDLICEPSAYLTVSAKVRLLSRLHDLGLLPNPIRSRFVQQARVVAINTPEADFINDSGIRDLFEPQELQELSVFIREEMVPSLSGIVDDWRWNIDSDDDPDEYFAPLDEVVSELTTYFADNTTVTSELESVSSEIQSAIDSINESRDDHEDDDPNYRHEGGGSRIESSDGRSIFDDVDS